MIRKILPLMIALLAAVSAGAQIPEYNPNSEVITPAPSLSNINDLTAEDYMRISLPPLTTLLENARNNPVVRYYNERNLEEISKLKSIKRNWLTYFKLNANYQYGRTNDNTWYEDFDVPTYNRFYDRAQLYWAVGASVSFPLIEIFDRRNRIKGQMARVRQTEMEANRWLDDRDLLIVQSYTDAVRNLSMLRALAEAVTISSAQYKVTELDFINGKVDAQTLSRQKNILTQNVSSYEDTRAALNNALLRLEILSKTRIISK